MPDTVDGVKTPFSNWKMIHRVLRALGRKPALDDFEEVLISWALVSEIFLRTLLNTDPKKVVQDVLSFVVRLPGAIVLEILRALIERDWRGFVRIMAEKGYAVERRSNITV